VLALIEKERSQQKRAHLVTIAVALLEAGALSESVVIVTRKRDAPNTGHSDESTQVNFVPLLTSVLHQRMKQSE
jgi:hypothetical protein